MPIYSDSRLSLYERCPRAYKYKYLEDVEVEEVKNIYAFLGSRVHETLELLHRDLKNGKRNSLETLLNYYERKWVQEWSEDIQISNNDYSPEHFKKIGEHCIENYYDNHEPFDRTKTIDTELRLHPRVRAGGEEYNFLGYIDRLALVEDGSYEIHDYKTSRNLPRKKSLENDRQLALYQLGVQQEYPDVENVELVWHYVRFGKDIRISHSDEDIKNIQRGLVDIIQDIEQARNENRFPTMRGKGARCDWCNYKELCPEWRHLYETEQLSQNEFFGEEGVSLVDKLTNVDRQLDKIKEEKSELEKKREKLQGAILRFAREEDLETVYGTEKKASVEVDKEVRFPKSNEDGREELERLIKEANKWDKVSYLSVRVLERIYESGEWSDDLLEKLGEFERVEERKKVELEDLDDE